MTRLWRRACLIVLVLGVLVGPACQAATPAAPTPTPAPIATATAVALPPTAAVGPAGAIATNTSLAPTPPAPTPTPGPAAPVTPIPVATPVDNKLDPRFGVAEGFRNPDLMASIGAGWERVVVSWADIQPDAPDDFSWLGRTLPPRVVAAELARGQRLAGVLQFTPAWAATSKDDPGRSPPRNLDLPDDNPDNYWGRFVYETVRYYAGRIDEWIVWNEPEFKPGDAGGGGSSTWLGSDAEFARLMQVAYVAAKRANPNAIVAFPATSYWVDRANGRQQFYERYLRLAANNPEAQQSNLFHDAVPLNLYRAPDDLVRLHDAFKSMQRQYGVDKPLWLLELNAMPTDDRTIPCADVHAASPIQTTQVEQAAYAIQALALAAASGYERIGFYQMVDDNPCIQSAVWGLARDDGSPRPVARTLETAVHAFSGFLDARFVPLVRTPRRWAAWPEDPNSLTPNWRVYQVAFDLPGNRRVTVVWNGDGTKLQARIARHGTAGRLLTAQGEEVVLNSAGRDWLVDLPPATAHYAGDPPGYYFIGGEPRLLVEEGVAPAAPVVAPR